MSQDSPQARPEADLQQQLESAQRRIAQLETALMRRGELLEQRQAMLLSIQGSIPWKIIEFYAKIFDRLFPRHTRRRRWLKRGFLLGFAGIKWLAGVRLKDPGSVGNGLGSSTDPGVYARWIRTHEPDRTTLKAQRRHRFARSPLISIVVPTYNTPVKFLKEMIESVLAQTYSQWELCLADGASTAEWVRPLLERYAARDRRIRPIFLDENQGIVGNSNAAIAQAKGDFVCFLDHDDTLAPFALYEVVATINQHPDAELLYSDEDKLDPHGQRVEPSFKPDWSPETLRSHNYICHLTVMKRELLTQTGGFRSGFDGSQDHDLVLRASELAQCIVHVPHILYHWRMHAQSTASHRDSKRYAFEAGKKAVTEHLQRLGIPASVTDGHTLGFYQVIYQLPRQPLVSVIIPNRDQLLLLSRCLDSLHQSSYANLEILIVENGSSDPATFAYYREIDKQPHIRILEWNKPFNYAGVNNYAANFAQGELLLFLNNDIEAINPDWLEEMVKLAMQPKIGAVGAKLYYADDTIQHAGIVLGLGGIAGHSHRLLPRDAPGYMNRLRFTQNCAAVTGACLLTPTWVFQQVGGFDEGFILAFNDVDLCVQIHQAGFRIVWTPDAELYHLESKTRGDEDTEAKQARFRREIALFQNKWGHLLDQGDPYYSPHFRLDRADYCLKL